LCRFPEPALCFKREYPGTTDQEFDKGNAWWTKTESGEPDRRFLAEWTPPPGWGEEEEKDEHVPF